jgi:hypothetical protein
MKRNNLNQVHQFIDTLKTMYNNCYFSAIDIIQIANDYNIGNKYFSYQLHIFCEKFNIDDSELGLHSDIIRHLINKTCF